MTESRIQWLNEVPPTPEDHLAFALERQRERMLPAVHVALDSLTLEELNEIIELANSKSREAANG